MQHGPGQGVLHTRGLKPADQLPAELHGAIRLPCAIGLLSVGELGLVSPGEQLHLRCLPAIPKAQDEHRDCTHDHDRDVGVRDRVFLPAAQ